MKELKKPIKILKTHKEVYQNTLNTHSHSERMREREMKILDQAAMAANQGYSPSFDDAAADLG